MLVPCNALNCLNAAGGACPGRDSNPHALSDNGF